MPSGITTQPGLHQQKLQSIVKKRKKETETRKNGGQDLIKTPENFKIMM